MSSSTSPAIGFLCAVLSAFFNGSFTVPFKAASSRHHGGNTERARRSEGPANDEEVHPIVFTLYVSAGVFLSSMIFIAPFLPTVSINVPSLLAGFLFVLSVSASFLAVDLIGMALSQGIWSGSASVVSYIWGTLIFGDYPSHPYWSILGLTLLVIGIVGIAFCADIARSRFIDRRMLSSSMGELEPLGADASLSIELLGKNNTVPIVDGSAAPTAASYANGVFWACAVGLFGGSTLAPTHYLPSDKQGLAVLPSFGTGCIILAPVVLFVNNVWTRQAPPFNARNVMMPGLFSGLLWNISNLLALLAIPEIGYGVAYPLLQSAVLVSGVWGISVFREMTDRRTIAVFWVAGGILLLGAAMLAASR
mmetsp:Transcript_35746/g.106677  ORF Transcript_35746/g.106677 Transcript_35746/m.106677 type:complete len:364 (-) Transcript_35746:137-1228(-)